MATARKTTSPSKSTKTAKKAAAAKSVPAKTIKIALLGFGTVGGSVAKVLAASKFAGIELTHVFNRDVARKRASDAARYVPASVNWTEDFSDIVNSDVDIVVELMGGLIPAEAWLRKALVAGKSVVTANKQLIAYRGAALARLAEKHGVYLSFRARCKDFQAIRSRGSAASSTGPAITF
jgi:homoserine dehydrogenase